MAEDTQAPEEEQVENEEATQVNFGQGDNDTSQDDAGQVEAGSSTWQDDKRFNTHWGEDPNKMYESLRYHEKKQGDFDKQITDYKDQVESLQKYKDDYKAVEDLFNHEQMGSELLGVINKYQSPEQQQEAQQEVNPMNQQLTDLMSWRENIEKQALNTYYSQEETKQFKEIDSLAKDYNLQYDKEQFASHMQKNNVPREYWARFFKSEALPSILNANSQKSAETALKKSVDNQSIVSGANKTAKPNIDSAGYKDLLEKVLNQ